jgi:hypothetical protein
VWSTPMARGKGDSLLQGWAEHPELRCQERGKYVCLENFVPIFFELLFGYNGSLICAPCGSQGIVRHQVAYLLAADIVSGSLPIRLREVHPPVMITRNRCSRPRPRLLTCL